jgi:methionyl-tRNA synthetase
MMAALDVSQDDFIRTTEPRHYRSSEELWRRMEKAGDIYLGKYAGWYSVRQEAYFDEKETTLGPDGVRREPLGSPVEWTEEETYFFRLSAFQERLLAHYAKHPDFILPPERRNEVASFVKAGLDDLSISRTTVEWGIKVPDPTVGVRPLAQADARDTTAEARGLTPANTPAEHVMYVWVDALTNYITAAGFPDAKAPRWRYWPADVHIIGKDIVRFHAVYWPAFLMSAGVEPPKRVFAHGFLYNRGEKMSKSVGNVVDPFDLVRGYGVDQVRYFFLREAAFGQDGTYSHEAIVNRINADLANDLGNLAQRSLSMIHKNCDAKLPGPGALTDADRTILAAADGLYATAREAMDRQGIKHYLDAVWTVVADANRYFRRRGAVGQAQERARAHGHDPLRDGRGGTAGGDPGSAGGAHGRRQTARCLGAGCGCAQLQGVGRGGSFGAGNTNPAAYRRLSALRRASGRRAGARGETEEAETAQKAVTISPLPYLRGEG